MSITYKYHTYTPQCLKITAKCLILQFISNLKNIDTMTPFHYACKNGHFEIVYRAKFWLFSYETFFVDFQTLCNVYHSINRGFGAHSDIYNYLFPYFLHPFTHIAMAGTIFMTLAISFERYLGLCHPLLNPHSRKAWFYILPVVVIAVTLNVPKFLVSSIAKHQNKIESLILLL